jgi:hypothetical protein
MPATVVDDIGNGKFVRLAPDPENALALIVPPTLTSPATSSLYVDDGNVFIPTAVAETDRGARVDILFDAPIKMRCAFSVAYTIKSSTLEFEKICDAMSLMIMFPSIIDKQVFY